MISSQAQTKSVIMTDFFSRKFASRWGKMHFITKNVSWEGPALQKAEGGPPLTCARVYDPKELQENGTCEELRITNIASGG